jgi:hypothetical protein
MSNATTYIGQAALIGITVALIIIFIIGGTSVVPIGNFPFYFLSSVIN